MAAQWEDKSCATGTKPQSGGVFVCFVLQARFALLKKRATLFSSR